MRWGTAWLTTILVVTTSTHQSVSTIDHEPLEIIDSVTLENDTTPIIISPLSSESSTDIKSTTTTTTQTTLVLESSDDLIKTNSEGEIASRENDEDNEAIVDSPEHIESSSNEHKSHEFNTSEDNDVMPIPPNPDCVDEGVCNSEENSIGEIDEGAEIDNDNDGGEEDVEADDEDSITDDDDSGNNPGENDNGTNESENGGVTENEDLIVETKSGRIQGFSWQGHENIISYIDIPYGTITNAFQVATAANTWDTVHAVRDHNKRCPQLDDNAYVGDIDCLTLSIFKPLDAKDASVLFHIHADNFDTGSGDPSIYGPEYLVINGIILVLPNYRLGPLGFLCMQNETAPGNMALKDLSIALKWISENIEAFGGDPNNIAVSGDGKSGALAGLLALSPTSKNYVSKVIAESGSFLSYWALDRNPLSTAADLFNRLTAENTPSRTDISLEDLAPSTIVTAAKGILFGPCLETNNNTAFIVESPYGILSKEKFETTSFLIGSAMYAGVHEALLQTEESVGKLNEDFTLLLPDDLTFDTLTLKNQAGERVKTQYFGTEAISVVDVENLSLCFTDMGYLGPGIRSARLLVDAEATVYFYEFAFVGDMNRVLESVNHPVQGAVRGDIVGYLFTQDGVVPGEQQTDEKKIIETLIQMWTSFLKTGVPSTDSINWTKLEKEDHLEEQWLLIDSEPTMSKGIHVDRLSLWTEIYDNHYIDGNHGHEISPSVYTVLMLQLIFWLVFCRNVSHIY